MYAVYTSALQNKNPEANNLKTQLLLSVHSTVGDHNHEKQTVDRQHSYNNAYQPKDVLPFSLTCQNQESEGAHRQEVMLHRSLQNTISKLKLNNNNIISFNICRVIS